MIPRHVSIMLAIGLAGCSPPSEKPSVPVRSEPPGPVQGKAPRIGRTRPDSDPVPILFRDVSSEAGLTVPHFNAADGRFRLVETMGSGVGLLDYDGDGWLDIFIAQGSPIPRDPADHRFAAQLYRNNRDGTFTDVARGAGLAFEGFGQGVAVGDYDADGRTDLYVSGFGRTRTLPQPRRRDVRGRDTTGRRGQPRLGHELHLRRSRRRRGSRSLRRSLSCRHRQRAGRSYRELQRHAGDDRLLPTARLRTRAGCTLSEQRQWHLRRREPGVGDRLTGGKRSGPGDCRLRRRRQAQHLRRG